MRFLRRRGHELWVQPFYSFQVVAVEPLHQRLEDVAEVGHHVVGARDQLRENRHRGFAHFLALVREALQQHFRELEKQAFHVSRAHARFVLVEEQFHFGDRALPASQVRLFQDVQLAPNVQQGLLGVVLDFVGFLDRSARCH